MAINELLKAKDFTFDEIKAGVLKSLEGNMVPGKRIAGARIFYYDQSYNMPRHDVIFFWRSLYVSCVDEYEFAMEVFGDFDIYKKFVMCSSPYRNKFKPAWDDERERKHRSAAMKNVVTAVENGDVTQSKWLEKHLLEKAPKEEIKEKKSTKEIVEDIKPVDSVMDDIENNYKNIN